VTKARANLKDVSTSALMQLRDAIDDGHLKTPIDRAGLLSVGIRHQIDAIEQALAGHKSAACIAILDVALAERDQRLPTPELVWTGPEASSGTARDTAVVLRALFESARESVILAGYRFDHAQSVLAPLHSSMKHFNVQTSFFVDVPQVERSLEDPQIHLTTHLAGFSVANWPFGDPRPHIYYDKRALQPGPPFCSLHAKCVVVDGARAFVSSANFTQRGQERNIEVGVLIENPGFASHLAGQWLGLVEAGIVAEFQV
jgi:phosphatidylserine/phosphatidylglycerophosphate/cardiolipin synthase-like enzyme